MISYVNGFFAKYLFYWIELAFLGNALLRRLVRIGVLDEGRMKLDYVLGLKIEDFLERRLQTQVLYCYFIVNLNLYLSGT